MSVVNQTVAVIRHFHKERLRPQPQEVQTRITSVLCPADPPLGAPSVVPDIVIELHLYQFLIQSL